MLPPQITARVAIEQASTFGWARYTGLDRPDHRHAHLRCSAPLKELLKEFNFTADAVVAAAKCRCRNDPTTIEPGGAPSVRSPLCFGGLFNLMSKPHPHGRQYTAPW